MGPALLLFLLCLSVVDRAFYDGLEIADGALCCAGRQVLFLLVLAVLPSPCRVAVLY